MSLNLPLSSFVLKLPDGFDFHGTDTKPGPHAALASPTPSPSPTQPVQNTTPTGFYLCCIGFTTDLWNRARVKALICRLFFEGKNIFILLVSINYLKCCFYRWALPLYKEKKRVNNWHYCIFWIRKLAKLWVGDKTISYGEALTSWASTSRVPYQCMHIYRNG